MEKYQDRHQAGIILARCLQKYAHQADILILALPRGGVPVAYEIANLLKLPMDIFIVRKLGVPYSEELAMGGITFNDVHFMNEDVIKDLHIQRKDIEKIIAVEKKELERRNKIYRKNQPLPVLRDKTILLVDDGIATGATIRTAIKALKHCFLKALIVAVPVAPASTGELIAAEVDELVCPMLLKEFEAVGKWYQNFDQTTDDEVMQLMTTLPQHR